MHFLCFDGISDNKMEPALVPKGYKGLIFIFIKFYCLALSHFISFHFILFLCISTNLSLSSTSLYPLLSLLFFLCVCVVGMVNDYSPSSDEDDEKHALVQQGTYVQYVQYLRSSQKKSYRICVTNS